MNLKQAHFSAVRDSFQVSFIQEKRKTSAEILSVPLNGPAKTTADVFSSASFPQRAFSSFLLINNKNNF